jgi:hypothetical protein
MKVNQKFQLKLQRNEKLFSHEFSTDASNESLQLLLLSNLCSIFISKTKKIGFGYWMQAGNILCQNSPQNNML